MGAAGRPPGGTAGGGGSLAALAGWHGDGAGFQRVSRVGLASLEVVLFVLTNRLGFRPDSAWFQPESSASRLSVRQYMSFLTHLLRRFPENRMLVYKRTVGRQPAPTRYPREKLCHTGNKYCFDHFYNRLRM